MAEDIAWSDTELTCLLEAKICAAWPPEVWQSVTVLVAVSGGADSVALLRALSRLKTSGEGSLHVAHLNHGLRSDEANADQHFVQELSQILGHCCLVKQVDVNRLACVRGEGIEEVAREVRYDFFIETAQRIGARFVATAHTSDDQAETVLYRVLRGTGIAGLRGIPVYRSLNDLTTLVRPMLNASRDEVLAYLATWNQDFRSDSSNTDTRYMRNRIRHELLPRLMSDYHPRTRESLLRLSDLAEGAQRIVDDRVDELASQAIRTQAPNLVELSLEAGCAADPFLLRELLIRIWREQDWPRQSMGWEQWSSTASFIQGDHRSQTSLNLPAGIQVLRRGDVIKIEFTPIVGSKRSSE